MPAPTDGLGLWHEFYTPLGTASAIGRIVLAVSMGVLLLVGIHNAWDITVWTITRRREWRLSLGSDGV